MNCCKHKYFVIYRGDDTDFPGNQELIVELNTERDLTGCSAHFSFQGFTQDFAEIPSDKKLHLVIPNSETGKFALGAADAKLWLTNGTKIRTVESRIHIVVTNRVDEAYDNDDPQAITVTISGGGGGATVVLDDTVTETSSNGVKSSGIWSWVKSLLPHWLTSDYAEPATVASVADKANKSAPSAAGNLAALTADGDLEDGGKTVDDFLPRVSNGPVRSTFDIHGPLFLDMDGYIQLRAAGFIYGLFDNIREEAGSSTSLRTELDSKVNSFWSVGGASATVENGVAELSDFFTESNSLLTGTIDDRLPIPISAKSAGFTTESYKRFIVAVSGDMTVTLHTPTSGDAEIFECRFNGTSLAADASITFAGATATTMDANCGTVKAGKVALMSAFWNGTTWDVNWKVEV